MRSQENPDNFREERPVMASLQDLPSSHGLLSYFYGDLFGQSLPSHDAFKELKMHALHFHCVCTALKVLHLKERHTIFVQTPQMTCFVGTGRVPIAL